MDFTEVGYDELAGCEVAGGEEAGLRVSGVEGIGYGFYVDGGGGGFGEVVRGE